jgi:hypothetical protein
MTYDIYNKDGSLVLYNVSDDIIEFVFEIEDIDNYIIVEKNEDTQN